MNKVTVYTWDATAIYLDSQSIDPRGPMPLRSTLIAVPETAGDEVARWTGSGWEVLPERPPAPEPPPPAIPASVTMRQARRYLLNIGRLQDIDAAIDNLPEPQRTAVKIDWEYSQEVQRYSEFVLMLAPVLGWGEADLDNMFIEAKQLTP